MAHFPLKRITSVVAAIFVVVTCLLVTNSLGFAFNSANQQSRHLMNHSSNNGHLLALTSTGVRQAKSDMVQRMSTSQSTRDRRQAGQRTNMLHVIYKLVDHFERVQADSADASNELPIIQPTFAFNHKSRSSHSIENRLRKHFSPLVDGNFQQNNLSPPSSKVDLSSQVQEKPQSSPTKVSTLASRNSHRQKRDLNMGEPMNYISQRVLLRNRCSKSSVKLDDDGVNAAKNDKHTQFILVEAKPNATAIFSPEYKKFLCFDPSTGKVVPKDCFDSCLCAVHENITNNFHEFVSVMNPNWKLGFNRKGKPLSFSKVAKKSHMLQCFHFIKYVVNENEDEMAMSKYSNVVEENSCVKDKDWEKRGEELFKKEIEEHPLYKCILLHHPEVVSKSLSINSTKDHKRSLTEDTSKHKQSILQPAKATNETMSIPRTTSQTNKRRKSKKAPRYNRCIKPKRFGVLKVRHRNNKKRSSC